MITRRTFGLLVFFLAVFSVSAWGGYRLHQSRAATQQLAQPGWCCLPSDSACAVTQGQPECRAQGGTVFNWDQEVCNTICASAALENARAKTAP